MVKTRLFIHLHPSYSSIRNYQQYRFAKNTLIVNFYAHISCKNDLNNLLLLNTNVPLNNAVSYIFRLCYLFNLYLQCTPSAYNCVLLYVCFFFITCPSSCSRLSMISVQVGKIDASAALVLRDVAIALYRTTVVRRACLCHICFNLRTWFRFFAKDNGDSIACCTRLRTRSYLYCVLLIGQIYGKVTVHTVCAQLNYKATQNYLLFLRHRRIRFQTTASKISFKEWCSYFRQTRSCFRYRGIVFLIVACNLYAQPVR